MKKLLSVFLSLTFILLTLCACGNSKVNNSGKLKIVTTYFSAYNWTRNILGEKYNDTELILISDNGVDMHSYQPTADDIINIKTADLIIYNGSSSDIWVEEALNGESKAINSLSLLKDRLLYSGEDHHEHDGHSHNDESPDEHIWLSLKNAVIICTEIEKLLCEQNTENTKIYSENSKAYIEKLNRLDNEYIEKFSISKNKTVIFADRFPFRYTIADYSLEYRSLFEGCTSESDATIDAVLKLSSAIDETKAKYIFIIDKTSEKNAKAVIDNTKQKSAEILMLDSMQSVTTEKLNKNSYLSIMENNLSLILKSVNQED